MKKNQKCVVKLITYNWVTYFQWCRLLIVFLVTECDVSRKNDNNMKTVFAAILYLLGLVGSGLCAAHANPDPSILGDNMQSFTEDPYMTDEKFREKGKFANSSLSYCLVVRYLFIFDSFGTSQAVCRNLWYIKSPLLKVICLLLGWFVITAQVAKKSAFWVPNINEYPKSRK